MSAVPVDEVSVLQTSSRLCRPVTFSRQPPSSGSRSVDLGSKDARELAQACATDPSMTALLLEALASLGAVHRNGSGRYILGVAGPALFT